MATPLRSPIPMKPKLSEYETVRARNIERNNARLRALGLISKLEEERSNLEAWGLSLPTKEVSRNDEKTQHLFTNHRKRDRFESSEKPLSPARKSLRLKGIHPEDNSTMSGQLPSERPTAEKSEDKQNARQRRDECREARQRVALEYAALGAEKAAKENPTATYDHCLMRVRTMTDKQLLNRCKSIERAAGKHCLIKIAIFVSCLRDEEKYEIAEIASEALERLKALQPPPCE
jgi:hypothetical protein